MKPLNYEDKGCNYTSSNCVIWQGPDIACINLCKGDSVSDVVHKLATELCDVLTTLDISTYDISCLGITCAPKNFHDFLQALINIICELQECCDANGTGNRTVTEVTNTAIPIAPCFYYVNAFGDTVTTMTVNEYITAIGNRLCNMNERLNSVESTVAIHTTQINDINTQLSNPPPVVLPTVTPTCVLPAIPTPMNQVLTALEQQFCELLGATGLPSELYDAIAKQCFNLGQLPVLGGGTGNMNGLTGWNNNNNNAAATINNMWLTVCDLRAAVQNIKISCCPGGCEGIALNLQATLTGTNVAIFLTGTIPVGFTTCSPMGTLVTITDDNGGSMTAYMDIVGFINNPSGFIISVAATPINVLSNLHIHMEPCLSNSTTNAVCQSCLDTTIVNVANCPAILYTPATTSIAYNGTSLPGTAEYTVEIWNNLGTTLLFSQSQVVTSPTPFTGTFTPLLPNSSYKLRVIVTINGVDTTCQFQTVAVLPSVMEPIPLDDAATFGLLGGNGLTNSSGVGTSTFDGDAGSDPNNTVVGIDPLDVSGTLYTVADPAVVAAQVALVNAIANGVARAPYDVLPAADLAAQTITLGYHHVPGGVGSLTGGGTVTFDAAGDPTAVFVVHLPNGLSTSAASVVTLAGGALASNIFWIVGTTVSLGAGSTFVGTVLAGGNITVGAGTNIDGRLMTTGGLITTNTTTLVN